MSVPFRPRAVPVWATITTVAGIVVLCTLGTWQVKRLTWKESLIVRIETARAADPVAVTADGLDALAADPDLMLRARITGRYLHQHEIMLKPRPAPQTGGGPGSGKMGGHLVTPFLLSDEKTTIAVLRGWVGEGDDVFIQRPDGIVTITGTLRPPTRDNPFTPRNNPGQNMWFTLNPRDIAAAKGLDTLVPVAFYEETSRADVGWPVPVDAGQTPNNNHLSYAIFWFAMAGILAVMFVLRFIVYGRNGSIGADSDSTV